MSDLRLPGLTHYRGEVTSCADGRLSLRTFAGLMLLTASPTQLEKAGKLRFVELLAIHGSGQRLPRLLWIRASDWRAMEMGIESSEERVNHILHEWDEVLRKLD